jgi:hypothetical protein
MRAATHRTGAFDAVTQEKAGGALSGKEPAMVSITDRMFRFANDVAARVASRQPEKLLLFLVYGPYRNPPRSVRLAPNVMAQFCTMTWSHADSRTRSREMANLAAVAEAADELGIYDYFVNGKNGTFPRGFARVMARSLREFHELGCRHFATQAGTDFATNGFVYYLAARLLWNPELEVETVLGDFCRAGFGAAAETVRKYLEAFMDRWETAGLELMDRPAEELAARLYPRAWRRARRAELRLAMRAVAGDAAAGRRAGFLKKGMDFVEYFCRACESALELAKAGAPMDWINAPATVIDWAAAHADDRRVTAALAARQKLLDWVEKHEDGFWISAMWFRYQFKSRAKLIGPWLERVEIGRARHVRRMLTQGPE